MKTPDLANGAVVTEKLADGAVTGSRSGTRSLAGRDVLDNALKGADIDESTLSGVGGAEIGSAEPWHAVAPGSVTEDLCADPDVIAVFCTAQIDFDFSVWRNYGGAFSPAAFYKDQLGIVHLRGLVQNPKLNLDTDFIEYPIFRLPELYRRRNAEGLPERRNELANATRPWRRRGSMSSPNGLVDSRSGLRRRGWRELTDCSGTGGDLTLEGIAFRPN